MARALSFGVERQVLWALGGRSAFTILGFLNALVLARALPTADFGLFVLTVTLVGFASLAGTAGLPHASVRLLAKYTAQGDARSVQAIIAATERRVATSIPVAAAALAACVFLYSALKLERPRWGASLVAGCWSAAFSWQYYQGELFRGFADLRRATIYGGVFASALTLAFFAACYLTGRKLDIAVVYSVMAASSILSCLAGRWALAGKRDRSTRRARLSWIEDELADVSRPLWKVAIWSSAAVHLPVIAAAAFYAELDLALYGAAMRLTIVIAFGQMVVTSFIQPYLARFSSAGETDLASSLASRSALAAALPASALTVGCVVGGASILGTAFGNGFSEGATMLWILALGKTVEAAAGPGGSALAMSGHQVALLAIVRWSAIVQVGAVLLIAPISSIEIMTAVLATILAAEKCVLAVISGARAGITTHAFAADVRSLLGRLNGRSKLRM